VVICPVTSASHISRLYPSNVLVRAPEAGLKKDSVVLTLQVRAVARTRLLEQLGALAPDTLTQIEQAIRITLDLP
jgi:mRNA interferase MazF